MIAQFIIFSVNLIVLMGTLWWLDKSLNQSSSYDNSGYTTIWLLQGLPRLIESFNQSCKQFLACLSAGRIQLVTQLVFKTQPYEFKALVEMLRALALFGSITCQTIEFQWDEAGAASGVSRSFLTAGDWSLFVRYVGGQLQVASAFDYAYGKCLLQIQYYGKYDTFELSYIGWAEAEYDDFLRHWLTFSARYTGRAGVQETPQEMSTLDSVGVEPRAQALQFAERAPSTPLSRGLAQSLLP